ncbi:MAG TPA: hypothetical protein VFX59_28885 [Polyangiales bacterium]|nr:hypothetical protein [Polyangiales bacterium]
MYAGEGGEALVFDDAGNMYRGHLQDKAAFAREPSGLLIDYSKLKPL